VDIVALQSNDNVLTVLEQEEGRMQQSSVFDHTQSWRWYWTNLLLLCAIYSTTIIPYCTAFPVPYAESTTYFAIDAFMYITFALEVVINFNLDFVDIEGETIKDRKQVILRYLKGEFLLDVLQALPCSFMTSWEQNYLTYVTVLARFTRFSLILPLMNEINLEASTRSSLAVFMSIFRFTI
jgi:hypothetical protein